LHYLCCVIYFVEEESGYRKASLSGTKRKAEESAEEAESTKAAKGPAHADEQPTAHAHQED
jgi:hypothetical protein